MYDRKSWIVLILCSGLLATGMYFSNLEANAKKAAEENKQFINAAAAAQAALPALPKESTAELTVQTPPPSTERQTVSLENNLVSYTLTNIGGGIECADFKKEHNVGDPNSLVKINRFGAGAIGTLVGPNETIENETFSYLENESQPGSKVVYQAKSKSGLTIKKTFSLRQENLPGSEYLIQFDLELQNTSTAPIALQQWGLFLGEASPLYQAEWPQQTGFFWRENQKIHFTEGGEFKKGWFSSAKSIIQNPPNTKVDFAGVTNQFFATLIRPSEAYESSVWGKPSSVMLPGSTKEPVTSIYAGISLPNAQLQPGEQKRLQYNVFIGPKQNTILSKMEKHWGEGWGDVMQYGWFWFVSKPLNLLLDLYHRLFDGFAHQWAWGLAIIFLTITVRTIIWPLHAKSTRTMKRMAKLKPEMEKLKEKYANDPNKLNTETMGLYRKFGINPLGGCLPMFIQIPVFFGFYRMLQYAVELRGQGFLWVADLSQPDTLTHIAGIPINILPVIMAITSFLQIKMTPTSGDKMQQRMVQFMPFMFFFFCYNFASALALYWTTQNIFSICQTWLMNKVPEPELKARTGHQKSWVQRMAERQAELQKNRPGGQTRNVTPEKKKRNPRTGG